MSHYSARRDVEGTIIIKPRQDWYSLKQVESILEQKRMTVHRAVSSGALQAEKIGGVHHVGRWRVSYEALIEYIENGQKRAS